MRKTTRVTWPQGPNLVPGEAGIHGEWWHEGQSQTGRAPGGGACRQRAGGEGVGGSSRPGRRAQRLHSWTLLSLPGASSPSRLLEGPGVPWIPACAGCARHGGVRQGPGQCRRTCDSYQADSQVTPERRAGPLLRPGQSDLRPSSAGPGPLGRAVCGPGSGKGRRERAHGPPAGSGTPTPGSPKHP